MNIFIRAIMAKIFSIRERWNFLNGKFHFSSHENILTVAIHSYIFIICIMSMTGNGRMVGLRNSFVHAPLDIV